MTAAGTVHVACGDIAALLAMAPAPDAWLSDSETQRLAAIRTERRRASFLAARWQARWLLAQACAGDPADWRLDAPHDAPPRVRDRADLFLSISHSAGAVASALATQPVGIDLEVPRPGRDIAGLRELCCTGSEHTLFAGPDAGQDAVVFHELWTVKEAWLKSRGEWLAPSRLQQIEAVPDPLGAIHTWRTSGWQMALCTQGAPGIRWWTAEPAAARRWSARTVSRRS